MIVELPKTPPAVVREKSLPPVLEAEIALSHILTDFAVDLSIRWFILVRILFDQGRPQLRVGVYKERLASLVFASWKRRIPARYRSTVHHASVGGRVSRPACTR